EVAGRSVEERATARADRERPRCRRGGARLLEAFDDRARSRALTARKRDLGTIAVEPEAKRVTGADALGEGGGLLELGLGRLALVRRERDEPEDLAVEDREDEVTARRRELEAALRSLLRLVDAALECVDEREHPQ